MRKFVVAIILLAVCSVHAQTNDKETLKQINQKVTSLYQAKKFDEALFVAQQAFELTVKIYGNENRETAVAYTNLGVIYRQKNKFKESVENLQKTLDIYLKIPNLKSEELIAAYGRLAHSQRLSGKEKEAEANYLEAFEIAENKFGKQSKESYAPALNAANFYAGDKKFEKADELYLKSYAAALKNFDRKSDEVQQVTISRICLVPEPSYSKKREKAFVEAKKSLFGDNSEAGEVVNGKAKSLPQPAYPESYVGPRFGATVAVKVKIDEQGNVAEAKAVCGEAAFAQASEAAAKNAKFYPTTVDGKPAERNVFIVYNFVP